MPALRVLFVEDAEDDAQLVLRQLERGGYTPHTLRVETKEALAAALLAQPWDLIICDYSLPRFDALGALATLHELGLDIPFIIVSGTVGEDTAAAAMRAGAHDYLMKDKLVRLVAAVERECRDALGRAEQRRADQAARESAALYRSLVETLPDGVGLVGLDGRISLANGLLTSMHGYVADELLGQHRMRLFAPEDHARAEEAFSHLSATGAVRNVELAMARKDGSRFAAEFSATTIFGEHGQPKAFITVVHDITQRKDLQARLMVGDRMASVGTLAAGVAHEINNPLAYILANLETARRQVLEHVQAGAAVLKGPHTGLSATFLGTLTTLEESSEALGEAIVGAGRVRAIVRDLKAFTRTDEDLRGPVDLQRIVESSIRMASNEIRHRAKLVRTFTAAPIVTGNDGRLTQVFLNLLVNAAQAIPEGAAQQNEVRVSIHTEGARAIVDVGDTGAGIPAEARAQIFDPFFTTKPPGFGTGLGLSLCQGIVSSHGGELTFETEVGKGTLFHVALPLSRVQQRVAAVAPAVPCAPRRARILVVDDEPLIGAAVRRILCPFHEVVAVTSGQEALTQVRAGPQFDLILSDLMMPEMTGMDLYAELKRLAPALAEKIVFLTGGAFTSRAERFFAAVPNARVEKPFDVDHLLEVVNARLQCPSPSVQGVGHPLVDEPTVDS